MFDRNVLELDLEREATRSRPPCAPASRAGCAAAAWWSPAGGIDSSVTAARWRARARARSASSALLMPERDSSGDSAAARAACWPSSSGIAPRSSRTSPRRSRRSAATAAATRPSAWSSRSTARAGSARSSLPSIARRRPRSTSSSWSCSDPAGEPATVRMPPAAYLQIVAATNFKQRIRKMMEYYHADRLNYAVVGHAQPARVRPGLLRQERRRRGRRQADRAPLQDPGLRAGRAPGRARGDPQPPADHRHLLAAAEPGGVLLRAALRADGPRALGATTTRSPAAEVGAGARADRRRRSSASTATSRPSARATRYLHLPPLLLKPVPEIVK